MNTNTKKGTAVRYISSERDLSSIKGVLNTRLLFILKTQFHTQNNYPEFHSGLSDQEPEKYQIFHSLTILSHA